MMMLAAMLLVQAAASPQQNPAPSKEQLPTAKVECRMIKETGSRIPTRVCRLDKEWELLAKDAQDDLRSSRNKSFGMNPE